MTLLTVLNAQAHYRQSERQIQAVNDVSISLQFGEIVGIVGESGCGKSTLASVMSLNVRQPLEVRSGILSVDGEDLDLRELGDARKFKASRPGWRGSRIALLPQGALNALNPTVRVRRIASDILASGDSSFSRQEALDHTASRLEQLDLPAAVLDYYPHQLSGGMRQRVVTALSTLLNPKVLIADEPSSALDVSSQKLLVQMLQRMVRKGFIGGAFFITHDVALLATFADRIAVMYGGRVVEMGPTRNIIDHPQHPYTKALMGSVLVPEPHIRGVRLEGIAGRPPLLEGDSTGCLFRERCGVAIDRCATHTPELAESGGTAHACWVGAVEREEVGGNGE